MKSSNFLIEHQCPQCGAPAVLEETDRLFACEFCRVKSYLLEKGFFQYILPSEAPANKDIVWIPYWRFRGMIFSCLEDEIHHRFVDVSQQAVGGGGIPFTLGLRSQALKLKFVTPETAGVFLKPDIPYKSAIKIFEDGFNASVPKPLYYQEFIGEAHSLLYAPYYADGRVMDAILKKPVQTSMTVDELSTLAAAGGGPDQNIKFVPSLCPKCGWDMQGSRDSLVLTCKNCDTAWRPRAGKLVNVTFSQIPEDGDDIYYLPFWRIRAEVSGMTLNTRADLIKIGNLPRATQPEHHDIPFYFWCPAFKAAPKAFIRFGTNMTLAQPDDEMIQKIPKHEMHPVTLPITEAAESLILFLSGFMKPRNKFLPVLEETTVTPKKFMLVFVPFNAKHHDLVHPKYQVAVNKNMLKLAKNL